MVHCCCVPRNAEKQSHLFYFITILKAEIYVHKQVVVSGANFKHLHVFSSLNITLQTVSATPIKR